MWWIARCKTTSTVKTSNPVRALPVHVSRPPTMVAQQPTMAAYPSTYVATSMNPSRYILAMKHCDVMRDILIGVVGKEIEVEAPVLLKTPVRRVSSAMTPDGSVPLNHVNAQPPLYAGDGMLVAAASGPSHGRHVHTRRCFWRLRPSAASLVALASALRPAWVWACPAAAVPVFVSARHGSLWRRVVRRIRHRRRQ